VYNSLVPEFKELKACGKTDFYRQRNIKYQDFNKKTLVMLKDTNLVLAYSKEKDIEKLNSMFKPDVLVNVSDDDLGWGYDPIYEVIVKHK